MFLQLPGPFSISLWLNIGGGGGVPLCSNTGAQVASPEDECLSICGCVNLIGHPFRFKVKPHFPCSETNPCGFETAPFPFDLSGDALPPLPREDVLLQLGELSEVLSVIDFPPDKQAPDCLF